MSFTWMPLYREIATRLMDYEDRQDELLALLARMRDDGLKIISLTDRDAEGNEFPLAEIDPFTFFACFNKFCEFAHRRVILERIKAAWHLSAPLPDDADGIPLADMPNGWTFTYRRKRDPKDIPTLWRAAREGVAKTWRDYDRSLFQAAKNVRNNGLVKLSMSLFWLNPMGFMPCDWSSRDYFRTCGIELKGDSAEDYFAWMEQVVAKEGDNFPQIVHETYFSNEDDDDSAGEDEEETNQTRRVWIFAPGRGADQWDVMFAESVMAIGWDELGDLREFNEQDAITERLKQLRQQEPGSTKATEPIHASLACWNFAKELQPGDVVVARQGTREVVGYGVISGEYFYDNSRNRFRNRRTMNWQARGNWTVPDNQKQLAPKTLTELRDPERLRALNELLQISLLDLDVTAITPTSMPTLPPYSIDDALDGLFMHKEHLEEIVARLTRKKAIILQGPPGVGKTFVAKRIAFAMMEQKDESRVSMVQFHPSYGYEDFVQGYRPTERGGLERRDGVFLRFAKHALADWRSNKTEARDWFFIIDEINRGNLAKIFGELLMLIEADKRDESYAVSLTYSDHDSEQFFLPPNLHLIGTMNTADRSLAMVDYALRRRFAFITLEPAIGSSSFAEWLQARGATVSLVKRLQQRLAALNEQIQKERDLGTGFCIGHSFFCPPAGQSPTLDDKWFEDIVRGEIKPLLAEYFESQSRVEELVTELLAR